MIIYRNKYVKWTGSIIFIWFILAIGKYERNLEFQSIVYSLDNSSKLANCNITIDTGRDWPLSWVYNYYKVAHLTEKTKISIEVSRFEKPERKTSSSGWMLFSSFKQTDNGSYILDIMQDSDKNMEYLALYSCEKIIYDEKMQFPTCKNRTILKKCI